uniref:NAD(P)(+)--arginine ADP-ribosyltransferase n=1 Tax=Malurus cyaneus samueli TaxID=2593467 RepID=A0A8C5TU51_9PASS
LSLTAIMISWRNKLNPCVVLWVMAHTLMDMALHSFDDQYLGYREEMMEELEQGDCFQKEIAANKGYLSLWKKAWEALLKSSVDLLREMHDSHDIVLIAYTMNSSLHSQLNQATSTFKYFHFYLTTAIQIIKKWQSSMGEHKCYQVYRGVKDLRIEAMEGSMVQFGHFTSTSCLRNDARKFGNETWITVTTCLGAALQGFSYHTSEKEVLILPYEIFLVKIFDCSRLWSTAALANFYFYTYLWQAKRKQSYHCFSRDLSPETGEKRYPLIKNTLSFLVTEDSVLEYLTVSHPCLSVSLPPIQDSLSL